MNIKVRIDRMLDGSGSTKAYASVNLDDAIVIRDVSVKDGKNGLFAQMPFRSYLDRKGNRQFSSTVFGQTKEIRDALNSAVLEAYTQQLQHRETVEQTAQETEEYEEVTDLSEEDLPFEQSM